MFESKKNVPFAPQGPYHGIHNTLIYYRRSREFQFACSFVCCAYYYYYFHYIICFRLSQTHVYMVGGRGFYDIIMFFRRLRCFSCLSGFRHFACTCTFYITIIGTHCNVYLIIIMSSFSRSPE